MMRVAALAGTLVLSACATTGRVPGPVVPMAATVPAGMQYLYGSGEAAAISVQAWNALAQYVRDQVSMQRRVPGARINMVLAPTATLDRPEFERCGAKPLAAVFDVDETVLLNLGFEYDEARHPAPYDEKHWQSWETTGAEQVAATPGAVEALDSVRKLGVTVIFNSNRSAANAAQTAAAIAGAGLGPAVHGDTLFLSGDDATGSRKDGRRATIAAKYCVIAMGGDQLGDFSDLFNAGLSPAGRRAATMSPAIAARWGRGWFLFPNPVYGSALKGTLDDVFPADKRWPRPPLNEGQK